jgi:hypothetical protein
LAVAAGQNPRGDAVARQPSKRRPSGAHALRRKFVRRASACQRSDHLTQRAITFAGECREPDLRGGYFFKRALQNVAAFLLRMTSARDATSGIIRTVFPRQIGFGALPKGWRGLGVNTGFRIPSRRLQVHRVARRERIG